MFWRLISWQTSLWRTVLESGHRNISSPSLILSWLFLDPRAPLIHFSIFLPLPSVIGAQILPCHQFCFIIFTHPLYHGASPLRARRDCGSCYYVRSAEVSAFNKTDFWSLALKNHEFFHAIKRENLNSAPFKNLRFESLLTNDTFSPNYLQKWDAHRFMMGRMKSSPRFNKAVREYFKGWKNRCNL